MSGKGPLNWTTEIESAKTAGEVTALLARHGADQIGTMYDRGQPTGLMFRIDTAHGKRQFALPTNVEGTYKALQKANREGRIPPRFATREQAQRVSWRVAKNWLEAQLALIEAGVAEMDEVMFAYMKVGGTTLYQAFASGSFPALKAGEA